MKVVYQSEEFAQHKPSWIKCPEICRLSSFTERFDSIARCCTLQSDGGGHQTAQVWGLIGDSNQGNYLLDFNRNLNP